MGLVGFSWQQIFGEPQKVKSKNGKSIFWDLPFKGISKYVQDVERYTKIYKIPSGGWAVPPGPTPAPWAGPGSAPGPCHAGRPRRRLVFYRYQAVAGLPRPAPPRRMGRPGTGGVVGRWPRHRGPGPGGPRKGINREMWN